MTDKTWEVRFWENNGVVLCEEFARKNSPSLMMTIASIDAMGWLRTHRGARISIEQTEAMIRQWKKNHA